MKLNILTRIPKEYDQGSYLDILRDIAYQVDGLSEGLVTATHNATTAAPTTGPHKQGDFVRNSAPTEAGGAGSKYVIFGWVCVTTGTPGTWKECRFLTGN